MIKVGVLGATGYMGGEVIRVLLNHPKVEIVWATSRKRGQIEDYHPNLYGLGIKLIHPDDISKCDVVFMALPISASLVIAPVLLELGCRVIDLGAAFRFKSQSLWESIYEQTHD